MPKLNARENGPQFSVPDFSMPRTVIDNARRNLAVCDRQPATTGTARLRAVLELCAAQAWIDPDSIFSQPAFVASQADVKGLDKASQAMMLTLQAKILNDIYTRRSWVYNQVSAPDYPLPDKVEKWSGRQFALVTDSLMGKALGLAGTTSPLDAFAPCLDYGAGTLQYVPTVFDFVCAQGIDYLEDFNYVMPQTQQTAAALCDKALAAVKAPQPAYFFWEVKKASLDRNSKSDNRLLDIYKKYENTEAARYVLMALCRERFGRYSYEEPAAENESDTDDATAKTRALRDSRIAMLS